MKILAYINRPSVFLLACATYLPVAAAPVEISSGNFSAITIEPVRESGLNDIFIVNESGTVSVSYTATSASSSPNGTDIPLSEEDMPKKSKALATTETSPRFQMPKQIWDTSSRTTTTAIISG